MKQTLPHLLSCLIVSLALLGSLLPSKASPPCDDNQVLLVKKSKEKSELLCDNYCYACVQYESNESVGFVSYLLFFSNGEVLEATTPSGFVVKRGFTNRSENIGKLLRENRALAPGRLDTSGVNYDFGKGHYELEGSHLTLEINHLRFDRPGTGKVQRKGQRLKIRLHPVKIFPWEEYFASNRF